MCLLFQPGWHLSLSDPHCCLHHVSYGPEPPGGVAGGAELQDNGKPKHWIPEADRRLRKLGQLAKGMGPQWIEV